MKQPKVVTEYKEVEEQKGSKYRAEVSEFSANGLLLSRKVYSIDGSCVNEDQYEYDDEKRLVSHKTLDEGEIVEQLDYTYLDDSSKTYKCLITHSWGGQSVELSNYDSDNSQQIVERNDEDGQLVFRQEYVFYTSEKVEKDRLIRNDEEGETIIEKEFSEEAELEYYKIIKNGKTEYCIQLEDEVDEHDVVQKTIVRNMLTNKVDQEYWKDFDENGNEIVVESIDHTTGQELIEEMSYSADNKLIEKKVTDASDTIIEYFQTAFNENGDPTFVKRYVHMQPIIISTFEYEYH